MWLGGAILSKNKNFPFEVIEHSVHRVLNGDSRTNVARSIGTTKNTVGSWVLKAQTNGIESLVPTRTKGRISVSEKIELVKLFKKSNLGMNEFSRIHSIKISSTLRRWLKKYDNDTLLEKENGSIHMPMRKKAISHTLSERTEVVNWLLQHERNYAQAAIFFSVSYQQAYSWLKKYDKSGPEGLKDHRGRNNSLDKLSELDKLRLENKKLKQQLQKRQLSDELLKKYREIERRHQP